MGKALGQLDGEMQPSSPLVDMAAEEKMKELQVMWKKYQSPGQVFNWLLQSHGLRIQGKQTQRKLWSPLLAVVLGRASRGLPVPVVPEAMQSAATE